MLAAWNLLRCRNSRRSIGGAWEESGECSCQASGTMGRRRVSCSGRGDHAQALCPHGALGGHKQSHPQRHNTRFNSEACLASGNTWQCLKTLFSDIESTSARHERCSRRSDHPSFCGWCSCGATCSPIGSAFSRQLVRSRVRTETTLQCGSQDACLVPFAAT